MSRPQHPMLAAAAGACACHGQPVWGCPDAGAPRTCPDCGARHGAIDGCSPLLRAAARETAAAAAEDEVNAALDGLHAVGV